MTLFLAPFLQRVAAGAGEGYPCAFARPETGIEWMPVAVAPSWELPVAITAAPGPGDDDEDDEDKGTGSGGGGNIEPDDDDYASDDDEDDDEDPLWAAPAQTAAEKSGFAAPQHPML
jgi:hypothetical protein